MNKRKDAITQEQVNEACNDLIANGERIKKTAVRDRVGGSFTTIGRMVDVWEREHGAQAQTPVLHMPEAITAAMHKATSDIWQAASTLASESIERIQSDSEAAIEKAKGEVADYGAEVTRLEGELDTLHGQLKETQEQLHDSQAKLVELQTHSTALQGRLDDKDKIIEQMREDYATLQKELIAIAKKNGAS